MAHDSTGQAGAEITPTIDRAELYRRISMGVLSCFDEGIVEVELYSEYTIHALTRHIIEYVMPKSDDV